MMVPMAPAEGMGAARVGGVPSDPHQRRWPLSEPQHPLRVINFLTHGAPSSRNLEDLAHQATIRSATVRLYSPTPQSRSGALDTARHSSIDRALTVPCA